MKYAKEWAEVQEIVAKVTPFIPADKPNPYDPSIFNYETFERDVDIGVANGYDIPFQIQLFKLLNDVVIKAKAIDTATNP